MILRLFFLALLPASPSFAAEEVFAFRFALREPQHRNLVVSLQGQSGSGPAIAEICGAQGALCSCEARDPLGNVIEVVGWPRVSYDPSGNYFSCRFVNNYRATHSVRVFRERFSGPVVPVSSSISLGQLLGDELDQNHVRSIYRYSCEMNYLQKEGTTTQGFDCSSQASLCDTGNFCLLQSRDPYFLFADTYSTNFFQKPADGLYNGGGTNLLCGLQIKRYNCADADGWPTRQFGLYGEATDFWTTAVSLTPAPEHAAYPYGYAAKVSPVTGACPPGLEKRALFAVRVATSDITPSHNFTDGMVATEVSVPDQVPAPYSISKWGQGNCDGRSCTHPISYAGPAKAPQMYSRVSREEFCVIPTAMLP